MLCLNAFAVAETCVDLKQTDQSPVNALEAAYASVSNRASSRSV
ncbi:acetyltransferase [Lacticaseibacillus paracasei]|nr:acetyltransferase [Lacticaseibacillus paracasei]MCT3332613.1 acetyltransferase [Lacticaseibacillus paracasei]